MNHIQNSHTIVSVKLPTTILRTNTGSQLNRNVVERGDMDARKSFCPINTYNKINDTMRISEILA